MTTIKRNTKMSASEDWVVGDGELMKLLIKEALQEVLEGEMTEFLGAAPSECTEERQGYRAAYYGRNLITRGWTRIWRALPSAISMKPIRI